MPLPKTKKELLTKLEKAFEKLNAEFDMETSKAARSPSIEGNISCCDVIAYQIGWGRLLIGWEQAELSGIKVDMPCVGYKWNQLGALAQSFYRQSSQSSLSQLQIEFNQLYQQLVVWITQLTDEDLFVPQQRLWTGERWPMVKWIQINTIAPYQSARTKIRRWKREANAHAGQ